MLHKYGAPRGDQQETVMFYKYGTPRANQYGTPRGTCLMMEHAFKKNYLIKEHNIIFSLVAYFL